MVLAVVGLAGRAEAEPRQRGARGRDVVCALPAEPGHRAGTLPERPCHRGLREALRPHLMLNKHRQEGMGEVDKRGAHRTAQTHV